MRKPKAPTEQTGASRGRVSGVKCQRERCPFRDTFSCVIHQKLTWTCSACGYQWHPTPADLALYNSHVAPRDQIAIA